jgi:hypothetical protein
MQCFCGEFGKWGRDKGTRGQGDKETRGQGDRETRRQGDKGTRGGAAGVFWGIFGENGCKKNLGGFFGVVRWVGWGIWELGNVDVRCFWVIGCGWF